MRRSATVLALALLTWGAGLASPPAEAQILTLEVEPESVSRAPETEHTLTATVRDGITPAAGVNVDFEIGDAGSPATPGGPNDPDAGFASPPDFTCTTGAAGTCQVKYTDGPVNPAAPNNTDLITAWIDEDNVDATVEADPEEGRDETQEPGESPLEPDNTDVVQVAWSPPGGEFLDVEPDFDRNLPNSTHTLTATVTNAAGDPVADANVDFTKEAGPGTLSAPECNTAIDGTCSVTLTSAGTGLARIRSWIDGTAANNNDLPNEADPTEGRNEAASPGQTAEPDDTDVVEKSFENERNVLEVSPEQDQNKPGTVHALDATVTNNFGDPKPGLRVGVAVRSGPNAGRSFDCTSDAEGKCSVSYTDMGEDPGVDQILAWVDVNKNGFADAGEADLAEGRNEAQSPGATAEPDATDVVDKEWATLDLRVTPELGRNAPRSQHTLTATLVDGQGKGVADRNIDFEVVEGPNADLNEDPAVADRECQTGADGKCTVMYTSNGEEGTDFVRAWVDRDGDDAVPGEADTAEGRNEDTDPGDEAEPDATDVVREDWGATECPGHEGEPGKHIVGTEEDDVLTGTPGRDVICGLQGDDDIDGRGGNDLILGGPGKDRIDGGGGSDDLRGGSGPDDIRGGGGRDELRGNAGNDDLRGGAGDDDVRGGGGNDALFGNEGDDFLHGGTGRDRCRGGPGANRVRRCET